MPVLAQEAEELSLLLEPLQDELLLLRERLARPPPLHRHLRASAGSLEGEEDHGQMALSIPGG